MPLDYIVHKGAIPPMFKLLKDLYAFWNVRFSAHYSKGR